MAKKKTKKKTDNELFGHIKRHDILDNTEIEGNLDAKSKRGKPRRLMTLKLARNIHQKNKKLSL